MIGQTASERRRRRGRWRNGHQLGKMMRRRREMINCFGCKLKPYKMKERSKKSFSLPSLTERLLRVLFFSEKSEFIKNFLSTPSIFIVLILHVFHLKPLA